MNRTEWSPSAAESQEEEQCLKGSHGTTTYRSSGKRRLRTNFTEHQSAVLEQSFTVSHYPDQQAKREMALRLGIPEDRITVWFQNRRAKWRRKEKKSSGKPGQGQKDLGVYAFNNPDPEIYAAHETTANFGSQQQSNAEAIVKEPTKVRRYNNDLDASNDAVEESTKQFIANSLVINIDRSNHRNIRSESEVLGSNDHAKVGIGVVFGDLFNDRTSEDDDDPSGGGSSVEDLIKDLIPFCPPANETQLYETIHY